MRQIITLFLSVILCTQGFAQNPDQKSEKKAQQEVIPDWLAKWEIARVLSYQKKYDESIREYEELIRQHPDLIEARLEMAKVYYYQGNYEETMQILNRIPKEEWDDSILPIVANIYVSEKNYKEAEDVFLYYLNRHPNDLKTRLKYADMLSWEKRYEESIQEYQKILSIRPQDRQLRRKYAFVLIWMGKHDEGIAELRKTLERE